MACSEGIHLFVETLAQTPCCGDICNQYAYDGADNAVRRANLSLYLQQMSALRPGTLLVGEAPGYRGCRLTGVPFTSEAILLGGIEAVGMFGTHRGYLCAGETARTLHEQTATIIWEGLASAGVVPLLWNAYPFHPHRAGEPNSNRAPSPQELRTGGEFLRQLVALFGIEQVIAVGNVAEASLLRLGFSCCKIRHPANGGKRAFLQGLAALDLGNAGAPARMSIE